jgi:hypothetical protein
LAIACDDHLPFGGGTYRADSLLTQVPARAWQQISCGKGAKGHRLYQWAFLRLDHHSPTPTEQAGRHWLMVRRNRKTGELAFYRCYTPRPTPLATLVRVAGRRWTIEERFRSARAWSAWTSSGAPLAVLVPLGHPGDGCPRLPGGGGLDRTHPIPTT